LIVAGVGGGVGTSTVAGALGAADGGVFTGRPAQILVCRPTVESVVRAGRAARLMTTAAGPPVLAVKCVDQARPSKAVLDRLRVVEPNLRATILLPHVAAWRDHPFPLDAARLAMRTSPGELTRATQRFVDAVRHLATAAGITVAPTRTAAALQATRTTYRGVSADELDHPTSPQPRPGRTSWAGGVLPRRSWAGSSGVFSSQGWPESSSAPS
jgi:hypothetical protein